jgi:predicted permease
VNLGPGWARLINDLTARLQESPGVIAAGAVSSLPLSGAWESGGLTIPGRPPEPPGTGPNAQYSVVSGNYFGAAGIKLIAGRTFDARDDVEGVRTIIVNREFVRRYLTSEQGAVGSTVGAQFEYVRNAPPRTIVGVVDNVKITSLDQEPTPQVYVPESQFSYPGLAVVLRTDGDPRAAIGVLRSTVREVSPQFAIDDMRTFDDVVSQSLARQRFSMTLIGAFALLSLALAVIGLYGVLSLLVGQRSREIGVRLALGATRATVMRMVVAEGSWIAGVGIVLGVIGAFALTRLLQTMVYDIATTDLFTFAAAAVIVAVVSVLAAVFPARRASRVDPNKALAVE